jgi:hypothetical protein
MGRSSDYPSGRATAGPRYSRPLGLTHQADSWRECDVCKMCANQRETGPVSRLTGPVCSWNMVRPAGLEPAASSTTNRTLRRPWECPMSGISPPIMTFSCPIALASAIQRPQEPLVARPLRQRDCNLYQAPYFGDREVGQRLLAPLFVGPPRAPGPHPRRAARSAMRAPSS